jgi:hypothetical protein
VRVHVSVRPRVRCTGGVNVYHARRQSQPAFLSRAAARLHMLPPLLLPLLLLLPLPLPLLLPLLLLPLLLPAAVGLLWRALRSPVGRFA